jgi:hypothetical protein
MTEFAVNSAEFAVGFDRVFVDSAELVVNLQS